MRKILGMSVTAFLVAGGLVFGSSAAANATEECVPIPASAEWVETIPAVTELVVHPAEFETVVVTPAVEGSPAVYEIEYEFRHKHDGKKTKWSPNPNWNAESNGNSKGWYATGATRNGKLISAEVLPQEEVTEQKLIKEETTETVIITPEQTIVHPAVEAVTCDDEEEPPTEEPPVIDPVTTQLKWLLPDGGTESNVTWPQTPFDDALVPCGETVTVQVDTYPYTTDADKARTDALDDDGFLLYGEDHGWAQSWYFETFTAPDCEVPATPVAHIQDYISCDGGAFVLDALGSNVAITYDINGTIFEVPAGTAVHTDANGSLIQPIDGKYVVTASHGETELWSKTFDAKPADECEVTPPVEEPTTAANPNALITAVCGEGFVLLTNPFVNGAEQLTASFVVNVDGVFYGAYSAEAGARVEETIKFGEDTGTHKIEVYQAGTSEWKLLASVDVISDCLVTPPVEPPTEEPPTEEPPTEEPPVVEPPVVEPPVANPPVADQVPVKAAAVDQTVDGQLSQTGSNISDMIPWGLGALMMILAGIALVITRRFVATK